MFTVPAARPRNASVGAGVTGPMTLLWAFLCAGASLLAAFVAYWFAALGAGVLPIGGSDADFEIHRWTLSIFVALWGPLAAASVLGLTRVFFGAVVAGPLRGSLAWVLAGTAIAAGLEFTLLGWGSARFGQQGADPDLIGATAFLAIAVIAVAIGVFTQIVAPRACLLPRLATLGMAVIAALIVTSNVPGLSDGIEAASIPLGVMVAASGVYVSGAAAFSLAARAHRDLDWPESAVGPDR